MNQDIPQWIIAGGVLVGIYRQWRSDRKIARTLAETSAEAKRAAQAARAAAVIVADKTSEHASVLVGIAEDIHKIEVQGNSKATRLEEAARAQGHLAGVVEGKAEAEKP